MEFEDVKTDWKPSNIPIADDFNRIERNIDKLKILCK